MKNILATLLSIGLLFPSSAFAVTLQADDTVAGLGTDIDITDATSGEKFTVVITPPLGTELVTDVQVGSNGTAHLSIPGSETEVAGTYQVSLEKNAAATGDSARFEVLADATHGASSSITTDTTYLLSDGADAAKVTVILRDRYGNALAGRPVKLISSRSQDIVQAVTTETNDLGEQVFTVRSQLTGTITLRALDFISGEILAKEVQIDVGSSYSQPAMGGNDRNLYGPGASNTTTTNFFGSNLRAQTNYGPVAGFVITAPRNLNVNEDATIRITAVDADGNRVEDYTGTVLLSSTDPNAFLPINGQIPFRDQDFGEKQLTLGLRFRTADEHELHAIDASNTSITGFTTISVSGSSQNGNAKLIQIDEPKDNTVLNQPKLTITGTTEPFVNLIVTGGIEDAKGETDINGEFSITVELDVEKAEHTLRVRDDSGLLDSGNIDVELDTVPPEILSIHVSPENPTEGTDALIVVETDSTVAAFTAKLDGETIDMNTAPGKPNTYQALIEAPQAGSHELRISVIDEAQNEVTETYIMKTSLKGLPKVTGVEATTEGDVIDLQWDAITAEEVDAYRIYVGQSPTDFEFHLDSNYATTAAQIAGLQPGTEYYFSVTGLKGERESEQKSDVVKAVVFGIRLDVQAQNNAIQLDWSNMQTTIPLSSFILEYGVEPGNYTEKRILNGNIRNYTIRDLINEVTYYMQLTPVSLTGDLVESMVATAEGKPLKVAGGFTPSTADAIPTDLAVNANLNPPPNLHQAAPNTTSTGLPSYMWWVAGFVAAGIWSLHWKRKQKYQSTLAFMQAMDERYRGQ